MAIKIKFDLFGNPEPPTIILANRNGNMLGQLKVNNDSIELAGKLNDASEISFTINKYIKKELSPLWDKVVDFKLVYCKEWDAWFEIKVELDEETETVKTVFCTQLGQSELSQIMLYNIEINTEKDIERDDYKISILYDKDHPEISILNRILNDKAPHYSVVYVSPTIAKIQRSFSFDDTSILDAFQEIAKEIGCLFQFSAGIDENGRLQRKIAVFDLQQYCNDCNHRSEYADKCPKCGSTNIINGYGDDTLIFVTSDELASSGIQLVTDTDSVKNCFRLEAGDDLMTATIRNCNPNGSEYIWYFSDAVKEDMPNELVKKIESYDELYRQQYNDSVFNIDNKMLSNYNSLVDKYFAYNKDLQKITTPIVGYSNLMNAYYNTIDLSLYLESSLMPSVEISKTNAREQASLLTASSLSPVAVADASIASLPTANSAVLAMAKIIVKPTFKVEIKTSELSTNNNKKYWIGRFVVTNYSDDEDVAESGEISVEINDDLETVTKQKIDKVLNKENTDDLSITGLFEKEYNDFCAELKKYALTPLTSFYNACQTCIDILIEQGVADKNTWSDNASGSEGNLYEKIYLPYYNKLKAIEAEMKVRGDEINLILGIYDADGNLITDGLQTNIEQCRNKVQTALDFKSYLGDELWLNFCAYRREDTYSNSNYISDGLNNAELFKNAQEFFEVAENEIYKSAELQHSISTTLNNLLAIKKFKPLVNSFENGNWIRVQVDDEVYKLRLIEYDIDFGNFEKIPVEFSDVTKVKNGITDVESILSQASSMATSYESVKRQSTQGNKANDTINQWINSGLNSALVRIQNNDSEDIVIDRNGLLCRSYDDITDTYEPEQFRLTHNIMAYTTDNWKTVSTALGKHGYTRWNNHQWIDDVDYGLSTTFVTAGYVTGSQVIGGEIISSNYKTGESGTYFNLIDGDFELAGGKFVYDNANSKLTIRDVGIDWSSSTNPDIKHVIGLEDSLNGLSSEITMTAKEIRSEVSDTENKLSSSITQTAEQIRSEVKSADDKLSSSITQNADNIALKVSKDGIVSAINLSPESIVIKSNKIDVDGVLNVTKLNALKITAGSVAAENITGTTISGKTISGGTVSGATITGGSLNIGNDNFVVDSSGKMTAKSGTFSGSLDAASGTFKGKLSAVSGSFTSLTAGQSTFSTNSIKINASYTNSNNVEVAKGSVYIGYSGGYSDPSGNLWDEVTIRPSSNNIGNIGTPAHSWDMLCVKNGAIQSSDRNCKTDISEMGEKQERLFELLNPVTFKFIDSTYGRFHYGFISQEVEEAIIKSGLSTKDFAGFCKDTKFDDNGQPMFDENGNQMYVYALRYNEFIALNTHMIQKLKIENRELAERVLALENKLKQQL